MMRICRAGSRWLGLGLLFLAGLTCAWGTQLEDIHVSASDDRTRVVFDLSGPIDPDLFMLAEPARLVVDLPQTSSSGDHADAMAGKGVVKRLRTGTRQQHDLRVVLDLAHTDVRPDSYTLTTENETGLQLVVDLYDDNAPAAEANPEASAEADTPKPAADTLQQTTTAAAARDTTPVAHAPPPPTNDIVVVIDAGHGGHDPGAIGSAGTTEKSVALAMARRLATMIDQQQNMRAKLTRDADVFIGLRDRIRIAREADADLFISIHANSSRSATPRGAAVFALSLDGATSEHAHLLAQRENSALMVGGVSLQGKDLTLASFMLDLAQSATVEASLDLGRRVLDNFNRFTTLIRPQVEQAAFVVLKSPDVPSLLVETGFISNPQEERKLGSSEYQTHVARALLQAIKGYFDSYRPGTVIAGGQVHKVSSGETLSGIAHSYHVDVERLRRYNAIEGNIIRVGQELQIPPPKQQVVSMR